MAAILENDRFLSFAVNWIKTPSRILMLGVSYIQINLQHLCLKRCIRDFMVGPGLQGSCGLLQKKHVFTKKYIVVSFLDKQYVGPALILISWVTLMNEIHRNGTAQGEHCVDCNKKSNLSNKRPSTCLTVKWKNAFTKPNDRFSQHLKTHFSEVWYPYLELLSVRLLSALLLIFTDIGQGGHLS